MGCISTSAAGTAGTEISDLMYAGQFSALRTYTAHLTTLKYTFVNTEPFDQSNLKLKQDIVDEMPMAEFVYCVSYHTGAV